MHRSTAFTTPAPIPSTSLSSTSSSVLTPSSTPVLSPCPRPCLPTRRRVLVPTATQAPSKPKPGKKMIATTVNEHKPTKAPHMGKLLVMGLSHHTATVEVREKLAIPEDQWQSAAGHMLSCNDVSEAAILSTCNRFEVYLVADHPFAAIQQVIALLSSRSGIPVNHLRKHLFMLTDDDACWHLFRVSAGLDSLVVGEGQILAQVKRCYELATDKAGHAGKILTRLLNTAVSAGKRVRSETGIAKGAVSISSAAVELAELRAQPDLGLQIEDARVSIIGAGKMSRLLVQHLLARGVADITIVNRSMGRAEELVKMFPDADIHIELMPNMPQVVARSDVVFTSTAAEQTILTRENLTPIVQQGKNYVVIDISVPRNVASDVNQMSSVQAYNVDDLKAVVAKNQARRRRLVLEAEVVLREEQATFNNWHSSLGCIPAISKLQQRAESIRQDEIDRVKGKLAGLSPSELKAVEQLSKGIINKMLHSPMVHLRGLDDMEERTVTLKHIEALFKL